MLNVDARNPDAITVANALSKQIGGGRLDRFPVEAFRARGDISKSGPLRSVIGRLSVAAGRTLSRLGCIWGRRN